MRLHSGTVIIYLVLNGISCADVGDPTGDSQGESGREIQVKLDLIKTIRLEDDVSPIQWLRALHFLPDGTFASLDFNSRVIRRFGPQGELLGYLDPTVPSLAEEDSIGLPDSKMTALAVSKDGQVFVKDPPRVVQFHYQSMSQSEVLTDEVPQFQIASSPSGKIYALGVENFQPPFHVIHEVVPASGLGNSFLEADDFCKNLNWGYCTPSVDFDNRGNIFVIGLVNPTLFVFGPDGGELQQWDLRRSPAEGSWFRPVIPGFNPYDSTRNEDLIRAWEASFTMFTELEYLERHDCLVIFAKNDPETEPNALVFYSTDGGFIGTVRTSQFLVAADDDGHLYLSDHNLITPGEARISVYDVSFLASS